MRSAQRAFRKRQKVLVESQEHKLQAMESAILDLTDSILQSKTCTTDGTVVRKIGDAVGLLKSLSKDDEGPTDHNTSSPQVGTGAEEGHEDAEVPAHSGQYHGKDSLPHGNPVGYQLGTWQYRRRLLPFAQHHNSAAERPKGVSKSHTLPRNISTYWPSILETHPFAIRLLHSTLTAAHAALIGGKGVGTDVAMRLFRYALLYHTRDELLENLQRLLRRGPRELPRL